MGGRQAGILEFAFVHEHGRVEGAAPRLVGPTADGRSECCQPYAQAYAEYMQASEELAKAVLRALHEAAQHSGESGTIRVLPVPNSPKSAAVRLFSALFAGLTGLLTIICKVAGTASGSTRFAL